MFKDDNYTYILVKNSSGQKILCPVKIAFVNSRKVDLDTVLADGDRVGLTPAVGGM